MGDRAKERIQQRLAEMEAGRKAVILWGKFEKIEATTTKLNDAFPRVHIGAVLNKPYTHVTIRASIKQNEEYFKEIEFIDPIDEYPSEHLIAQLALIS